MTQNLIGLANADSTFKQASRIPEACDSYEASPLLLPPILPILFAVPAVGIAPVIGLAPVIGPAIGGLAQVIGVGALGLGGGFLMGKFTHSASTGVTSAPVKVNVPSSVGSSSWTASKSNLGGYSTPSAPGVTHANRLTGEGWSRIWRDAHKPTDESKDSQYSYSNHRELSKDRLQNSKLDGQYILKEQCAWTLAHSLEAFKNAPSVEIPCATDQLSIDIARNKETNESEREAILAKFENVDAEIVSITASREDSARRIVFAQVISSLQERDPTLSTKTAIKIALPYVEASFRKVAPSLMPETERAQSMAAQNIRDAIASCSKNPDCSFRLREAFGLLKANKLTAAHMLEEWLRREELSSYDWPHRSTSESAAAATGMPGPENDEEPNEPEESDEDLKSKKTPYEEAMRGGRHAGWARDMAKKSKAEIQRGIRSLERQIESHKNKIANPEKRYPGFGKLDPRKQRANVEEGWPSEIKDFEQQKAILEELLRTKQ